MIQPTVDIKTVMSQLMERLSKYAAASPEVLPEFLQVEAFTKFSHAVVEVATTTFLLPVYFASAKDLFYPLVFTAREFNYMILVSSYIDYGICVLGTSFKTSM